ncbi:MAG: rod shape-determining protein MreC [Deltaproteobacteria bacterium]|nr:MAG: rod shape-determining protein MreC [Deltaproteobacteria bacterium]
MTLRRRLLDYGLVVLLLAVPAAMLTAHWKDPADINAFDRAVLRVSSPLQAAVSWVVEGVGGWWNRYVWLVDVEEENEDLRAANAELRRQLAEARRRAAHVDALEQLAGLRRTTAAETIGARVISSGVNPHFRVIRIRLDRGDGEVAPGMPVIAPAGLVGRVQRVYGRYSDVLLATDPESAIDVVVERTGGRGVLRGVGRPDAYTCEIEYLERGQEVAEGDEVVTSGLGGALPAGIRVGRISKVVTKSYSLYQEVEVEPAVDFGRLRHVLVVLAPPPPPDPRAGQRRRSRPAYSLGPYR